MLEEFKNIKSTKKDLKNFGLVIGIALLILAGFLWWKDRPIFLTFGGIGIVVISIGFIFPIILKPFQIIWMVFAVIMGFIMTRVILSLLFYLVLTSTGLLAKLFGKKFLDLKLDASASSYWIQKPKRDLGKKFYERQF